MSDSAIPVYARPVLVMHGVFEKLERGVGLFFQTVLTIMFGVLLIIAVSNRSQHAASEYSFICLMTVAWGLIDLPSLWRTWKTMFRGERPLFIAAALRPPLAQTLVRPLLALWWLGHFLLGLVAAVAMQNMADLPWPIAFLCATMYGMGANGYLIFTFASLTRSKRILGIIWSLRILIDVGLGLAGLLAIHFD